MPDSFDETHRDILIELRSDMKHIRGTMDNLRASEQRQWERLDDHGGKLQGHDKTIGHLTWGFRTIAAGIVTVACGVGVYIITHLK